MFFIFISWKMMGIEKMRQLKNLISFDNKG